MKHFLLGAIALGLSLHSFSQESKDDLLAKKVLLPNGWTLTPVGTSVPLGDLPLNIAVSASGHYAAVTNNGQSTQTIQLIDVKGERNVDIYYGMADARIGRASIALPPVAVAGKTAAA